MDSNLKTIIDIKVNTIIKNLKKNNMNGYYVKNTDELMVILNNLIEDNITASVGGSMTLFETGVINYLRERKIIFLDRYKKGLTPNDIKVIYRKSFSADVYLTSSNAITENGELYNVDGRGNRVAAMLYGPEKVIVILGVNKIVKTVDDAIKRNKEISAPANAIRLNRNTPCKVTGSCSECSSPDRICSLYTLIRRQFDKDRIHVIIMEDNYGY